jgi:TRAP-type mannitol/chloroaromatic compound transport system substrate-binding protein
MDEAQANLNLPEEFLDPSSDEGKNSPNATSEENDEPELKETSNEVLKVEELKENLKKEKQEKEENDKKILETLKNFDEEKFKNIMQNFPTDETQYKDYIPLLLNKK